MSDKYSLKENIKKISLTLILLICLEAPLFTLYHVDMPNSKPFLLIVSILLFIVIMFWFAIFIRLGLVLFKIIGHFVTRLEKGSFNLLIQ
ncbi:hypothetical protein ACVWWV_003725 [Bacillus sp. TE9122W]